MSFRQLMVDLKSELTSIHESFHGDTLTYLSAGRFDQQDSTKPHLDGGPEECFLMLGYEPSVIHSVVEIIDYSKCAFDRGVTPTEFMAHHNPMFQDGYEILLPYFTVLSDFSFTEYQILLINNSSSPYSASGNAWQGVLHTASIPNADLSKRRVINSTMIARVPKSDSRGIDDAAIQNFIHTSEVRRRGYDRPDVENDK